MSLSNMELGLIFYDIKEIPRHLPSRFLIGAKRVEVVGGGGDFGEGVADVLKTAM